MGNSQHPLGLGKGGRLWVQCGNKMKMGSHTVFTVFRAATNNDYPKLEFVARLRNHALVVYEKA